MAEVRLEGVSRAFADGTVAVAGVDLEARDGEYVVLVGPSGSGKSTLLRIVAGLEAPSEGRVWVDGRDVTELPPQQRDVAMVFQSYALYPHMTVRRNLAFGLRMRKVPKTAIAERVAAAAALLGLEDLMERRPAQLSGGQRQRVALGRAIVREPAAFLLDEPLSNLDPTLRVRMRTELARLQGRLGATVLHVTHDQEEAMTLGHRVAVLEGGRIQQVAPPLKLYRRPMNLFVAGFIGSPSMNLIPCAIERDGDRTRVRGPGITLDGAWQPGFSASRVTLGIRPEHIVVGERGGLGGTVERVEPLGAGTLVHVAVRTDEGTPEALDLRALVSSDKAVARGDEIVFDLPADRRHWFDSASGRRID